MSTRRPPKPPRSCRQQANTCPRTCSLRELLPAGCGGADPCLHCCRGQIGLAQQHYAECLMKERDAARALQGLHCWVLRGRCWVQLSAAEANTALLGRALVMLLSAATVPLLGIQSQFGSKGLLSCLNCQRRTSWLVVAEGLVLRAGSKGRCHTSPSHQTRNCLADSMSLLPSPAPSTPTNDLRRMMRTHQLSLPRLIHPASSDKCHVTHPHVTQHVSHAMRVTCHVTCLAY